MLGSKVMWEIFSSTGSVNAYLYYKKFKYKEVEITPSCHSKFIM
jgi:hypothetical protein